MLRPIRRVITGPDAQIAGKFDRVKAFEAIGASEALDPDGSRHPGNAPCLVAFILVDARR